MAEVEGDVVGVAGYRILRDGAGLAGKTTLLAVLPEHRELGIGRALQGLRMDLMRDAGASRVITNADRPETIAWYERHFGYHRVGEVEKIHEFGLPDVNRWTGRSKRRSSSALCPCRPFAFGLSRLLRGRPQVRILVGALLQVDRPSSCGRMATVCRRSLRTPVSCLDVPVSYRRRGRGHRGSPTRAEPLAAYLDTSVGSLSDGEEAI